MTGWIIFQALRLRYGTSSLLLIVVLASMMNAQTGSSSVMGSEKSVPVTESNAASGKSPCRDKSARTPAQRKISSQLLCALYPPEPASTKPRLRTDDEGRVLVDIRAKVTDKLLACVGEMGGKVVSHSERYNSILAYVALGKLEKLAELPQVKAIRPAAEAITN
jgi:hypothetical protein